MDHIKIADSSPLIHYIADGETSCFTFPFPIFKADDLAVYQNKTATLKYSITGIGTSGGGTVTLDTPPPAGTILTLWRQLTLQRQSDFIEGGALRSDVLNDELDKITAMIQQIAEAGSRALSLSPHVVTAPDLTLPEPVAGRALIWDDDASRLINSSGAPDASNPGAAAGVYFTPLGSNLLRSVANRLHERRSVLDFIPADLHADIRDRSSTADLTAPLQAALDAGVGHFPPGCYTIYSPLMSSVGAVINMAPGAFINPQGTGYTALTITGETSQYSHDWNIHIHRTDFSTFHGNGIFWDNPANAEIGSLKVYACDGFGVKLSRVWDCHINSISTVHCGNANHYALSIESGGDTSNVSTISHIQVELSNAKAIYIDPLSINIVISEIHSERSICDFENITWYIGGRCTYNNIRLTRHENSSGPGKLFFEVSDGTIMDMICENNIPTTIFCNAGSTTRFNGCIFGGPVQTLTDQLGNFNFINCTFGIEVIMNTVGNGWLFDNCNISALTVGYITPPSASSEFALPVEWRQYARSRIFRDCRIGTLKSISNYACAWFDKCTISAISSPILFYAVYENCNITGSINCNSVNYLEMRSCRLIGTLWGGYRSQGWIVDSEIIGDLASDNSGQQPFAFNNVRVSGSVNPVFSTAPNWGLWHKGQVCDRMPPVAGSAAGWVFNGTTWLARPNL